MLVLPSGAVVPHTNPGVVANHSDVHNFAHYAFSSAFKLDDILNWCWGTGFSAYDCLMIASANGYAFCVTEPRRRAVWVALDTGYADACEEHGVCDSRSFAAQF